MENVFSIIDQSNPDRIHIRYKDKGGIYLIHTDEGIIIDVYNHDEMVCIDTMTVWDDDFEDDNDNEN